MQSRCSQGEVIATKLGYLITLHADCYTSPINYAETSGWVGGEEGGAQRRKAEDRASASAPRKVLAPVCSADAPFGVMTVVCLAAAGVVVLDECQRMRGESGEADVLEVGQGHESVRRGGYT
jgi:hypothetical protein